MGIGSRYWQARAVVNCAGALALSATVTRGPNFGLPAIFEAGLPAFKKGAELMLTVGASMLGFVIASVSLIYALTAGERFALLRESRSFRELGAASRAAMFWLLFTSLVGLIAVFVDQKAFVFSEKLMVGTVIFVSAQAVANVIALTWIISRLVTLA